jgi:hypothetical protein
MLHSYQELGEGRRYHRLVLAERSFAAQRESFEEIVALLEVRDVGN